VTGEHDLRLTGLLVAAAALSRIAAACGVMSERSQSKNTMNGPGMTAGRRGRSRLRRQRRAEGRGGGSGGGGGGGAAPKLKMMPPEMLCERKRASAS
jgi:hypothetical protein